MCQPGRPVGNFLFLGPTGTGKTRTVEALAESLLGDKRAVTKIDCAEFQHSHEIAKLLGSPPGYLGHRETHALLNQEALNQYQTDKVKLSFVLFDEIEKASDALWNLLLGVLDKGALTLGDNRKVDFSKCMIFMTSNLGAREMEKLATPGMGFTPQTADLSVDAISRVASGAAKRKFTPEFINRIDKTVVFKPLNETALGQILDLEIALVQDRIVMAGKAMFLLRLEDEARAVLLREGFDPKYGARHLKRVLEKRLIHPLANLVASGQIVSGDLICVSASPTGEFTFVVGDHLPPEDVV